MADLALLHDDEAILRASRAGGAEAILSKLNTGLDTPMGRSRPEAVQLSGGQWQRLALARAFLREQADILVLDEPTAALDAKAQHALTDSFKSLCEGRTSIVITHRFATARTADRIVVFEQGQLVEQGTHDELIDTAGVYARLFALQARAYK